MTSGVTPCALRVVSGELDGLSGRWRHGRARLSRGHISLRRHLWQTRFIQPFTATVEIAVESIAPPVRQTNVAEMWSLNPGLRIMTVETGTATLLWGVPERLADWAAAEVA
jgi:hypothetical protein